VSQAAAPRNKYSQTYCKGRRLGHTSWAASFSVFLFLGVASAEKNRKNLHAGMFKDCCGPHSKGLSVLFIFVNFYCLTNTVWMVDFETPVCKLYLLFITTDAAQEKK
jgi:hypothetical protein